jgi:hypothetical protein
MLLKTHGEEIFGFLALHDVAENKIVIAASPLC